MPDWVTQFVAIPGWIREFLPIAILLVAVTIVLRRLPRVDVGHDERFRRRRILNWLPLGLTYAFLYMGRYNLKVSKFRFEEMQAVDGSALMGNDDFGWIFGVGTYVYGFSFLLNGPLTDRFGGKLAILLGASGAAVANLAMGLCTWSILNQGPGWEYLNANFALVFGVLYALNMYFQSFGAVAIVKVNAPWFHVRERGVFGAIFGILISLGIYFAFDVGGMILESEQLGLTWVFFMPALLLGAFWVIDLFVVRNAPEEAGLPAFDPADASSGDDGPRKSVLEVFQMMLRNPIIVTIALVEFCSGFLRQAIMQWYRTFAKQTDGELGLKGDFVYENWGMLLCCAGILGGVFAGTISDHLFKSRRGPVAAVLYGTMFLGSLVLLFVYDSGWRIELFADSEGNATVIVAPVAWLVLFLSMAVIGVHGMLSGTASMDFGGKKNVGVAVGIIDGFVYLGTAVMSVTYGLVLPKEQFDAEGALVGPATDPSNWRAWPLAMVPVSLIGLLFALRLWNARPAPRPASGADEAREAA